MSHTPGPWHVDVDGGGFYISRPDNELIAATCNANFDDDATLISEEEEEANARLIAAAPDLLAALGDLLAQPNCANTERAARAAIAKATNAKG